MIESPPLVGALKRLEEGLADGSWDVVVLEDAVGANREGEPELEVEAVDCDVGVAALVVETGALLELDWSFGLEPNKMGVDAGALGASPPPNMDFALLLSFVC